MYGSLVNYQCEVQENIKSEVLTVVWTLTKMGSLTPYNMTYMEQLGNSNFFG